MKGGRREGKNEGEVDERWVGREGERGRKVKGDMDIEMKKQGRKVEVE